MRVVTITILGGISLCQRGNHLVTFGHAK